MKNSSRYLLIIVLLLLSWWLQNLFDRKPELITRDKSRFANYYLEDFKLTAHDKQGKIKYIIRARRLDNYEQESVAELQDVHSTLFSKKANWEIRADQAKIFQQEDKIVFFENVTFTRPAQDSQQPLTLQTEQMTLFTEKELLQTSAHVTIIEGQTRLEGDGLSYNSQTGTFKLISGVKATYVK
ncbi:MAG: LPS export ABC transporter periplasmic protein LptC [Gammaproteobacteria bacterium]|nr:LPS export ABC transporter periplasmic protein LptC [Gammaproteobacteria bacterium]